MLDGVDCVSDVVVKMFIYSMLKEYLLISQIAIVSQFGRNETELGTVHIESTVSRYKTLLE